MYNPPVIPKYRVIKQNELYHVIDQWHEGCQRPYTYYRYGNEGVALDKAKEMNTPLPERIALLANIKVGDVLKVDGHGGDEYIYTCMGPNEAYFWGRRNHHLPYLPLDMVYATEPNEHGLFTITSDFYLCDPHNFKAVSLLNYVNVAAIDKLARHQVVLELIARHGFFHNYNAHIMAKVGGCLVSINTDRSTSLLAVEWGWGEILCTQPIYCGQPAEVIAAELMNKVEAKLKEVGRYVSLS